MPCRYFMHTTNRILNKNYLTLDVDNRFGCAPLMKIITKSLVNSIANSSPTGSPGSGVGKGGGAGGTVRESGGGLGQLGAAREEQFFFNKQREQLEKIKKKLKDSGAEKSGDLTRKEEK